MNKSQHDLPDESKKKKLGLVPTVLSFIPVAILFPFLFAIARFLVGGFMPPGRMSLDAARNYASICILVTSILEYLIYRPIYKACLERYGKAPYPEPQPDQSERTHEKNLDTPAQKESKVIPRKHVDKSIPMTPFEKECEFQRQFWDAPSMTPPPEPTEPPPRHRRADRHKEEA